MRTTWWQAKNEDDNVMFNANYETRSASRINGGPPSRKQLWQNREADPKIRVHGCSSCLDSCLHYWTWRKRSKTGSGCLLHPTGMIEACHRDSHNHERANLHTDAEELVRNSVAQDRPVPGMLDSSCHHCAPQSGM